MPGARATTRQNRREAAQRSRVGGDRRRHRTGGDTEATPLANDDYSGTGYLQRFEPPPSATGSETGRDTRTAPDALDAQWSAAEQARAAAPPSPAWSFHVDTSRVDELVQMVMSALKHAALLPQLVVLTVLNRMNAATSALVLVTLVVLMIMVFFQ